MKQEILDLYTLAMAEKDETKKQELLSDLSELMQDNGAVVFDYKLHGPDGVFVSWQQEGRPSSVLIPLKTVMEILTEEHSFSLFSQVYSRLNLKIEMVVFGDLIVINGPEIERGYFQAKAKNRRKTVDQFLVELRWWDVLESKKAYLRHPLEDIDKTKDVLSWQMLESMIHKGFPLIGWLVDDNERYAIVKSIAKSRAESIKKTVCWEILFEKITESQGFPDHLATLAMFEYLVKMELIKSDDQGFILVSNDVTFCLRVDGLWRSICLDFADKSLLSYLVFSQQEIWQWQRPMPQGPEPEW
ncbi:MAG: hypothetical protein WCT18_00545 [Patescibacteria group bacterium]